MLQQRSAELLAAAPDVWERALPAADAFDALVAAIGMGKEIATPGKGFDRYSAAFYDDPAVALEAWIWGLPYRR